MRRLYRGDMSGTASALILGRGSVRALLIPGGPGLPAATMASYGDVLGEQVTCLLIDPPGTGATTLDWTHDNLSPFHPHSVAAFYASQIEACGYRPDVILGASFGALVSIYLAGYWPQLVLRAVLVSPVMIGLDLDPSTESAREALLARHQDQEWYGLARNIFDGWTELALAADSAADINLMNRIISPLYLSDGASPDVRQRLDAMTRTFDFNLGAMQEWERGLSQKIDATEPAAQIACPTLIISGEHDWLAGPHATRTMQKVIPNSRLTVLEDCGHFVDLEAGQACADALRDFLQ
jgi:proline iminopeptidase